MTITSSDIKLMAPERMTDEDDGGGMQTAIEIIDGESNNLFPDISRLDRTYGRVNLREFYPSVQTDTTDTYYGSHVIIADPADDPNVSALLFATGEDPTDRATARDHIENYVVRGPVASAFLYDRQLVGQRSVRVFMRSDNPLPEVGEVYCLTQNEDDPDEYSQYLRVTSVDFEDQNFTDDAGTFTRRVVTLGVGNALRYTFDGAAISRFDTLNPDGLMRETQVADAAKYYGAVRLSGDIGAGDLTADLDTIYGQLVPSTRGEAAIVDIQAGGAVSQEITSGPETFEISGPAHTKGLDVTLQNRAYTYISQCTPIPAKGSLSVDFRALGKWYRLTMNDGGELEGEGTGVCDLSTGSLQITLGALPDVDSQIIITWATTVHYTDRAGSTEVAPPVVPFALGEPTSPGSESFAWLAGGVAKSATANAAGEITGDATGHIMSATGEGWIQPTLMPDANSQLQIDYDAETAVTEIISGLTVTGGMVNLTLGSAPIKPGSVRIEWQVLGRQLGATSATYAFLYTYIDGAWEMTKVREMDGGNVTLNAFEHLIAQRDDAAGGLGENGNVDYTTGATVLEVLPGVPGNRYGPDHGGWESAAVPAANLSMPSGTVTARYIENTGTPTARSVSVAIPAAEIKFLPLLADRIVPGTLRFAFGGVAYSDRAGQGLLYLSDGTVAGSVDYSAAIATLSQYTGGGSPTVGITSLVSTFGDWFDYEYFFRTPGSPLQPGGFLVNATDMEGNLLTETTDFNGYIASSDATGFVEQEMGVVRIKYGALVADADLTPEEKSEDWYDPANVDGDGNIWRPAYVFPSTVRFSCVVYTHLPLDADVLGLDPVRLPSDGRVPIVRPGDVLVVHQTEALTLPNPVSAGGVVQLPDTSIASCGLIDAVGAAVPEAAYSVDRKLGRVTMADPLDLTGLVEPLDAVYRIEAMQLVSDVQINGTVTCVAPFAHDFDAAKAYASTALILGDLTARVTDFFHQSTWTNVWDDSRIGDDTTAKYNAASYPIAVRNDAAIKQRWLIKFVSSTTFVVIGETVGQIATGNITADLTPINPLTELPYFSIDADGWGSGWSTGNCVRFNTVAASAPVWSSRCVISGEATNDADSFSIQVRGDAD
jgi:hypothetical protein